MNFSTPLGIAAVTYVLKQMLTSGLGLRNSQGGFGIDIFNDVKVSIKTPDKMEDSVEAQLNLFMYMVSYNSGWRNQLHPARNSGGARIENPPLAVDLHYLLSAYDGGTDINRDVLLGFGMQVFHDNPTLSKAFIDGELTTPTPDYLNKSKLQDQVEQIKISPETLTTEEISRLWSAFGAKYRPSAAYKVTVVLMQTQREIEPGPPVRSRNVYVKPFKNPVIEKIIGVPAGATKPDPTKAIVSISKLSIQGYNLQGEIVELQIGGKTPALPPVVTDKEILSTIPAGLKAGAQTVQVIHNLLLGTPAKVHIGTVSNAGIFLLAPTMTPPPNNITIPGAPNNLTVSNISPAIEVGQKVYVLLEQELPAGSTQMPKSWQIKVPEWTSGPINSVTVDISNVDSGDYKIRLRVDNAESE